MGNRSGVVLDKLPGKTHRYYTRFTEAEFNMLTEIAKKYNVSINSIIRALVRGVYSNFKREKEVKENE